MNRVPGTAKRARAVSMSLMGILALGTVCSVQASATPSCSDSYVVQSAPLRNYNSGQAEWSYGYVQLWYDGCSGNNWGRLVSLLNNTTAAVVNVHNNAGAKAGNGASYTPLVSGDISSPNNPASAYGWVKAGGVQYTATAAQPGA